MSARVSEWGYIRAKGRTVFTCDGCGVEAAGGVVDVESHSPLAPSQVDNFFFKVQSPRPYHMPVGWASSYGPTSTLHKCPECAK